VWSDAEDVVQDAWLRWRRAGPARYDVDIEMQRDVTQRFLDASLRRVVVGSDKVARFAIAVAREPGVSTA
jgi:hypothetical protein